MSFTFRLPDIGEGLDEAEIVEWLVQPGDTVVRDQALVEVLTDKASSELPSPVAGVVLALGGSEGDVLRVGDVLIEIENGSSDEVVVPEVVVPEARSEKRAVEVVAPDAAPAAEVAPAIPGKRPKASPATRKLARERGIDLASVSGSGPGGRITTADLDAGASPAAEPRSLVTPPSTTDSTLGQIGSGRHALRGVRGVIARNMAQSWSEIPHIHTLDDLDASLLLDLRTRMQGMGREVTPLAVALVASARALRRYPLVNACIEDDEILVHERVNLGVAVATDGGLVVPVLEDADRLDVFTATAAVAELAERARAGSLTATDLRGATFTITNYGSLGGRWATPIIPPGQAAIFGMGRIADQPTVVGGAVVVRPLLPFVFGADHRLVDGDLLEAFKSSVVDDLTEPLRLLVGT
ncbi:MAG: 2-oxo acid dehydrogenase subunit E2 [Actinobacteria bacterium]|nr:2-oxo acid dehydrogenase subunit E2 [Actinomycetota bacterium]